VTCAQSPAAAAAVIRRPVRVQSEFIISIEVPIWGVAKDVGDVDRARAAG